LNRIEAFAGSIIEMMAGICKSGIKLQQEIIPFLGGVDIKR